VKAVRDTLASARDRASRTLVLALLGRLRGAEVVIEEGEQRTRLGASDPSGPSDPSSPSLRVRVHHPRFYSRAVLGGTIGASESYMDGDWDADDLPLMFRLVMRNATLFDQLDRGWGRVLEPLHQVSHRLRRNSRQRARENIGAHYDLGNDFFEAFLDPSLTYSAGIFETPEATLEQASIAKYARLCERLDLRAEDHVLEIGSGWGGFALYAASTHGCRVTSTTISHRQWERARQRVAAAGLEDRVTILHEDYRDLRGTFDKLVSIEMIEAVGHQYLDEYVQIAHDRLHPGGAFALQAILIPDQRFDRYKHEVDFIRRYVFPGGCLPSTHEILSASKRQTDFRLIHFEDITDHYTLTLERWYARFCDSTDDLRRKGYDERLLRMWGLYLCSCAALFEGHWIQDAQMVLGRPEFRSPSSLRGRSRDHG